MEPELERTDLKRRARGLWEDAGMFLVFAAMFVVLAAFVPFFFSVQNMVGLALSDRGELVLGLGLAAVTIWIIFQRCELVLATAAGKRVLLRHRDIVYVRKLRNRIDDLIEARRDGAES